MLKLKNCQIGVEMSLNKFQQTFCGFRHAYKAAYRVPIRYYTERSEEEQKQRRLIKMSNRKVSASAKLAQSVECKTVQEAPEPIQRMVELEHVRSKINELDQRKLRHKEYAQMLKQLIVKPSKFPLEPKLPFKQPSAPNTMRQTLRKCSCMEEVLQLTDNPKQLATELVKLAWELNTEKRKNDVVLESYLELKQEMLLAKFKRTH